jgi:hypothetical protein
MPQSKMTSSRSKTTTVAANGYSATKQRPKSLSFWCGELRIQPNTPLASWGMFGAQENFPIPTFFSCEIELISVKFLRYSYETPAFQTCAEFVGGHL